MPLFPDRRLAENIAATNADIAMEDTCTSLGKRKYLLPEHRVVAVNVMRMLKTALDPHNLLNPGKILLER